LYVGLAKIRPPRLPEFIRPQKNQVWL